MLLLLFIIIIIVDEMRDTLILTTTTTKRHYVRRHLVGLALFREKKETRIYGMNVSFFIAHTYSLTHLLTHSHLANKHAHRK